MALVRGYSLPELAAHRSYEDAAYLVLYGELPTPEQSTAFCRELSLFSQRPFAADLARKLGGAMPAPQALAAAMSLIDISDDPAYAAASLPRAIALFPMLTASVAHLPSPQGGSYAKRALQALGAKRDDQGAVRALEVLLTLEIEHGLSASTFACRVAASSGAMPGISLSAAVATLSGPRHGGATSEARALLLAARDSGDVKAFVEDLYARKARLAGFGHRIYKVPDPRVPPLREAMHAMGDVPLLAVAELLEREGGRLWGQKRVYANIDLFSAALLDALGVAPQHYVAAFALGLVPGWLAHWDEQRKTGKLIRPESQYVGPGERALP